VTHAPQLARQAQHLMLHTARNREAVGAHHRDSQHVVAALL
jgi:hypothetical protein